MPRRSEYDPPAHDPLVRHYVTKLKRTDRETAEAIGIDHQVVTKARVRLGLEANYRIKVTPKWAPEREGPIPPERVNALAFARFHLGSRLREGDRVHHLDGSPAGLDEIMLAANRAALALGMLPCGHSPRWLP